PRGVDGDGIDLPVAIDGDLDGPGRVGAGGAGAGGPEAPGERRRLQPQLFKLSKERHTTPPSCAAVQPRSHSRSPAHAPPRPNRRLWITSGEAGQTAPRRTRPKTQTRR